MSDPDLVVDYDQLQAFGEDLARTARDFNTYAPFPVTRAAGPAIDAINWQGQGLSTFTHTADALHSRIHQSLQDYAQAIINAGSPSSPYQQVDQTIITGNH